LLGCAGDKPQMLQRLEALEHQNSSGEPMLNDTLAESLVEYFDRHGDGNQRMRARYILGRTYFCMGELPRALEMYNEAADCADTTDKDCDFAKLSRVYAQKAAVYYEQVQAKSQLHNLRLAEYYARKGTDSLLAIECHARQADTYELLGNLDSIIIYKEEAARMFQNIGMEYRANMALGGTIMALIQKKNLKKAKAYLTKFEAVPDMFNENGKVAEGREIYYYVKGMYFMSTEKTDSAEHFFRKAFNEGKSLNDQIAACKGLQEVFGKEKNPDSIAKYASLGYELNDSAYSLSEMQNIQKFQASYDFNHHKYLAEQEKMKAQIAWLVVVVIILIGLLVGLTFAARYRQLKNLASDYRLRNAKITRRLRNMANTAPPQYPTNGDWHELRELVEREIPSFHRFLNRDGVSLSDMEYDVCLMIRVQLLPIEISKLKKCSPSYISNIRKRLLQKIFGKEGRSEAFDDEIRKI